MLKNIFSNKNKIQSFWDWFSKNSDAYFYFENNRDLLFSNLKKELNKIHPDLVFEFSPLYRDGTREFVISADGIKSSFPMVTNVVNQAPKLKKWKFVPFRQPRKGVTKVKYENLSINLDDVFFRYAKDNGQIALELNIRFFRESSEWTAATFILLDNVLGEYHTEMSLSTINKKELDENEVANLFPIFALPQVIQEYQSELNN